MDVIITDDDKARRQICSYVLLWFLLIEEGDRESKSPPGFGKGVLGGYLLGKAAQQMREIMDSRKTLERGVDNFEATCRGGRASRRVDHDARIKAIKAYRKRHPDHSQADAFRNLAKAEPELGSAEGLKWTWRTYGPKGQK